MLVSEFTTTTKPNQTTKLQKNPNVNINDHELNVVLLVESREEPGGEWQLSGVWRLWGGRLAVGVGGHSWVSSSGSVYRFGVPPSRVWSTVASLISGCPGLSPRGSFVGMLGQGSSLLGRPSRMSQEGVA